MNSRYNSAFKIRRNLTDAGCEEQMIQDFFELGKRAPARRAIQTAGQAESISSGTAAQRSVQNRLP